MSARLLRRALSLALLLSLVSDGLPFDAVVPSVPDVDAAPVGPSAPSDPLAEVTPLGVAGTPNGEDLSASKVDGRVLLEPPVDAVPSDESLDERLARERASEPQPVSVGFDPLRSVEDVSERSRFGRCTTTRTARRRSRWTSRRSTTSALTAAGLTSTRASCRSGISLAYSGRLHRR